MCEGPQNHNQVMLQLPRRKARERQEILAALDGFSAGAALSKNRCVAAGGEPQQDSPRREIGRIPCIRAGLKQSPVPWAMERPVLQQESAAAFWGYPTTGGGRLGKQG